MSDAAAARREWARGWPLVLSCALGVSLSSAPLFALGQFMAPLEHAFGWTRTELSSGMTVGLFCGFILSPLAGRLSDMTNARWLALSGVVLNGLVAAAFSLVNGLWAWIALWVLHSFTAALATTVVWVCVIPGRFVVHRNLASAMALAGTSLAVTFAPLLARALLDHFDWRTSFQLFALIWFGGVGLTTLLFFHDHRVRETRADRKEARVQGLPSVWTIFKTPTFVRLALVVCAVKIVLQAYMVHLAPSFVDHGFSLDAAARLASLAGLTAIVGKLCIGWLFDRTSTSTVSAMVMGALFVASVLFAMLGSQLPLAVAATIGIGLAHGGLLTVVACLSMSLFPPQAFGIVFGAMASMMAIGTALGPLLAAMSHDRFGAYTPVYWGGAIVAVLALFAFRTLRPTAEVLAAAPAPAPAE